VSVASPLFEVHLLALPVRLAARSQQHFEELTREFVLIAAGQQQGHSDHEVPARLMTLVETLVQQFGAVAGPAEERLADAIDRGDPVVDDHVLEVPAEAGPAAQALGDLIDEADEYCRRGQHLLTLATPADCVAYRNWYLGQVLTQLQGAAPVPWTDSEQALSLR
jgi:hypothetical protein